MEISSAQKSPFKIELPKYNFAFNDWVYALLLCINIILKPEQEQFIQQHLKSRKCDTADEVIFEAFQLLEERDKHYEN